MSKIIQNALYCTRCKIFIQSNSVHDYQLCNCKDRDLQCMVDGGHDYIRTSINPYQIDFHVYDDMSISEMANKLLWGTYGRDGKSPFKWKLLIDCYTGHLQAIFENVPEINEYHKKVIEYLLER